MMDKDQKLKNPNRKEQQLLLMCSMEYPSYGVTQSHVQYNIHNVTMAYWVQDHDYLVASGFFMKVTY
jgi:hypothetical protein